jgi:hypothetical protein
MDEAFLVGKEVLCLAQFTGLDDSAVDPSSRAGFCLLRKTLSACSVVREKTVKLLTKVLL